MYTGIVLGTEKIHRIEKHQGYTTIFVENRQNFLDDVFIGASVAIDGTCLTVTGMNEEKTLVSFDISDLTLSLTTLGHLKENSLVNVERSFKVGMENGGHNIYGHIEGMAQIKNIVENGKTLHLDIEIPNEKIKYFFLKGFIGLHGCSLTVNNVNKTQNQISVDLIPETIRLTNFSDLKVGDLLNFEIDQTTRTLVDTLESIHARN
ncbi:MULTISPECIES: riboflavin synthase subunit alpha [unclassified Acinetobacter]|uniref:riboflavin synthase subunit alpha n=1 Tax=unclassified Acinetobacter TaxID=196816 RepID=UPI0025774866|nr:MULTISPECIES: riboflavin synthase subunit alpha [unclassified Acinetobacter]MDM1758207.1 riboflavin synthase subunit alpha [Acinetobacter sp. 256-1]MDM1760629.1 riboflavin synthase subunit alpha [Acinetobacter sp. 251-1]